MDVRELVTKLSMIFTGAPEVAKYEGAINKVKILGVGLGTIIDTSLKGLTVAAFGAMVKSTINYGDELLAASKITGLAVDSLERLRNAANLANVDQGTLTQSLVIFSSKLAAAKEGSKEAVKSFSAIGVNVSQIKDTQQGFDLVTNSLSKMEDGFKKTAAARDFFGRGGGRLVPVFGAQNTEEFKKFMDVLDAFGKGPNKKFAEQSDYINDRLDILSAILPRLKNTIVQALYPTIIKIVDGTLNWIAANKELIQFGLNRFLEDMVTVLKGAAFVVEKLGDGAKYLHENFKLLIPVIALLGAAFAPMTTMIAGFGLLLDDFIVWQKGGKSVIGALIYYIGIALDKIGELFDKLKLKLLGIFADIKNGFKDMFPEAFNYLEQKLDDVSKKQDSFKGKSKTQIFTEELKNSIPFYGANTNINSIFKKINNLPDPLGMLMNSISNKTNNFFSAPVINIDVRSGTEGVDVDAIAERVKVAVKEQTKEEYRTAFLNLQSIENRGLT